MLNWYSNFPSPGRCRAIKDFLIIVCEINVLLLISSALAIITGFHFSNVCFWFRRMSILKRFLIRLFCRGRVIPLFCLMAGILYFSRPFCSPRNRCKETVVRQPFSLDEVNFKLVCYFQEHMTRGGLSVHLGPLA